MQSDDRLSILQLLQKSTSLMELHDQVAGYNEGEAPVMIQDMNSNIEICVRVER